MNSKHFYKIFLNIVYHFYNKTMIYSDFWWISAATYFTLYRYVFWTGFKFLYCIQRILAINEIFIIKVISRFWRHYHSAPIVRLSFCISTSCWLLSSICLFIAILSISRAHKRRIDKKWIIYYQLSERKCYCNVITLKF